MHISGSLPSDQLVFTVVVSGRRQHKLRPGHVFAFDEMHAAVTQYFDRMQSMTPTGGRSQNVLMTSSICVQISYVNKPPPTTTTMTTTTAVGRMKSVLRSLIGPLTTGVVDDLPLTKYAVKAHVSDCVVS
jgi:hypothetical protein